MDTIFVYFIAGSLWVYFFWCLSSISLDNNVILFLSLFITPILGFIIVQTYRLYFELKGGFSHSSRRSLLFLWNSIIKPIKDNVDGSKVTASNFVFSFLVWETTFYSEGVPKGFQEHGRRAWYYILSFKACSYSIFFGSIALLFYASLNSIFIIESILILLGYFTLGIILFLKANQTFKSLMRQEICIIEIYRQAFETTAHKLKNIDEKYLLQP